MIDSKTKTLAICFAILSSMSSTDAMAYVSVTKDIYLWDPFNSAELIPPFLMENVADGTFVYRSEFAGSIGTAAHTDGVVNQVNGPFPTVSAFTSYEGPETSSVQGNFVQSILGYSFRILGPAEIDVPLLISGGGLLTYGGSGALAFSRFTVRNSDDVRVVDRRYSCGDTLDDCGPYAFLNTVTVKSFLVAGPEWSGRVTMTATATSFPGLNGFGFALLDPFIEIDPQFLASNPGYRVIVADGQIGNGLSAVPEASTWAMMIWGFGAVGFLVRRRALAFT